jgi:hypothetical protein
MPHEEVRWFEESLTARNGQSPKMGQTLNVIMITKHEEHTCGKVTRSKSPGNKGLGKKTTV